MPSRNEIQFFSHPLLLRLLGIIIKGRSRDSESQSLVLVAGEWDTHLTCREFRLDWDRDLENWGAQEEEEEERGVLYSFPDEIYI